MKKFFIGVLATTCIFSNMIPSANAHTLSNGGSENNGWLYVGSHWPSRSTNYFEATTDLWDSRFTNGISKFRSETSPQGFSINKVAVGNSDNFIEDTSSPTATWDARRTFYSISNQHPTRWRIQFNSAKSSASWETVSAHEIGHIYGLGDLYEKKNDDKLMYGYNNGERVTQQSDKIGFQYVYPLIIAKDLTNNIEKLVNIPAFIDGTSNDFLAKAKVNQLNQRVIDGLDTVADNSASYPKVSPTDAYKQADIVVKGKIESIEKEYMTYVDIPFTDFNFKVDEFIKNDEKTQSSTLNNQLIITQDGNSEIQFDLNPLLSEGNEYLLFLKRVVDNDNNEKLILVGGPNGYFSLNKDRIDNIIDINSMNGRTVENLLKQVVQE